MTRLNGSIQAAVIMLKGIEDEKEKRARLKKELRSSEGEINARTLRLHTCIEQSLRLTLHTMPDFNLFCCSECSIYCCPVSIIDLTHWRHRAAMLGVQSMIALYALVICCWHIADNCVYAAAVLYPPREGTMRLWRHMHFNVNRSRIHACCMF